MPWWGAAVHICTSVPSKLHSIRMASRYMICLQIAGSLARARSTLNCLEAIHLVCVYLSFPHPTPKWRPVVIDTDVEISDGFERHKRAHLLDPLRLLCELTKEIEVRVIVTNT
ncbi:hypothetical protein M413DRAFT_442088 [Hebeloma cylindrosporum]|uniref:Uncharacterized protein n=1 Tax=Hebeloma cylindrosporum TaxID=76867 RepID=A0A0C3CNL2_HEBCY|nr:hypothetical protein M413DRAFT_442088 [Hebeloma cylindrosporum h7]